MFLLLLACKIAPAERAYGEGVLSEGCALPGEAIAREIGVDATLPGEVAVGTQGDFLLLNEHAAFVVVAPGSESLYYYYGGVVADAVAVSDCQVVGQDELDEMGLVLGNLVISDLDASVLRAFEGTSAETFVTEDGAAVVRVTGTDSPHWLVEYEQMLRAMGNGGRDLSSAWGLEVVVDYVLEPGSPVLRTDVSIRNTGDESLELMTASLLSFGPELEQHGFAVDDISIAGLNLGLGMPWLVATSGTGALAYSVEDGLLAYTNISGMEIAVDAVQALSEPYELGPGQVDTRSAYLAVGATDGPSATGPLTRRNPAPIRDNPLDLEQVWGQVVDADGAPLANARVLLEAQSDGDWGVLDEAWTDDQGEFCVHLPLTEDPWSFRLRPSAEGRDAGEVVDVSPGDSPVLELPEWGGLEYTLVDVLGDASPARIALIRESDGERFDLFVADTGTEPLPPGTYSWTVTRGYEFAPVRGTVTVPSAGTGSLSATLDRVVDTQGYMSVDTHVHTALSPDSRVDPAVQLMHAAAHGLEVVVNTEHEHVVDQLWIPAAAGVDAWVTNVIGQEVTATVPEHMTLFPVEPDGSVRGGIVPWYGMDVDRLFAAMRARSPGGINIFNHPSYMDEVGWDPVAAAPTLQDPTLLGLPADAALWSSDFDAIEVMNGHRSPFESGRFVNWQSLVNSGHAVMAVGCSDAHGGGSVGFPRTYFPSSAFSPALLDVDELVTSFAAGSGMSSAGAFARVEVDGVGPGGVVNPDDEIVLDVEIQAIEEADVTHFVVFANCDTVAVVAAQDPSGVLKHTGQVELDLSQDTQLVVAAFGRELLPTGLPQYDATRTPRVMTNPIYVDVDGNGVFDAPGGKECEIDLGP